MIRTVADLIQELEDLDPDAKIRIASVGHRSAFAYSIGSVIEGDTGEVYIAEADQLDYLPGDIRSQV